MNNTPNTSVPNYDLTQYTMPGKSLESGSTQMSDTVSFFDSETQGAFHHESSLGSIIRQSSKASSNYSENLILQKYILPHLPSLANLKLDDIISQRASKYKSLISIPDKKIAIFGLNGSLILEEDHVVNGALERKIYIRAGIEALFKAIAPCYDIWIWSALSHQLTWQMVKKIDPEMKYISMVLSKQNCTLVNGVLVKDLDIYVNIPKNKTVIIDCTLSSFIAHPSNGLLISEFKESAIDNELANAQELLLMISNSEDVREDLAKLFGIEFFLVINKILK